MKGNFLETDCIIESINALDMTDRTIRRVTDDIYEWKWVVIALHNAVQAFMVLALKGSNSFNVMGDKQVDNWLSAY